jgi:hypothetical protein
MKQLSDIIAQTKTVEEDTSISEGGMSDLHHSISNVMDKHIADYKAGHLGHNQFGERIVRAHMAIAKKHSLTPETAKRFVHSYVSGQVKEEVDQIEEKYMGFDKTARAVGSAALAAWIGRKKYGKKKYQKAAAAGKSLRNEEADQITPIKEAQSARVRLYLAMQKARQQQDLEDTRKEANIRRALGQPIQKPQEKK